MQTAAVLLLLSAGWPLWIAWRAAAATTLRHSLAWAVAAWALWLLALAADSELARYLALSLTGCAGVAVLGARRPGVGAWNFVVAGLLAVLLLPIAQGLGTLRVEAAQRVFLGATLLVPVVNYLPTRLALVVLLCGLSCAAELARLNGVHFLRQDASALCLAVGPWAGLLARRGLTTSLFEREWLTFRDGFGLVWGQRARDQFNRAAANAGWSVRLSWFGRERLSEGTLPVEEEMSLTLRAVLKRFGPPTEPLAG